MLTCGKGGPVTWYDHRDARYHRALVVRDGAGNGCARFLCPTWGGEQARAQEQRAQLDGVRAWGSAGAHPNPPDRAMWNKTNKTRVERRLKATHLLSSIRNRSGIHR